MRALLLDGAGAQDNDLVEARGMVAEELAVRGYGVECLSLRAMKMAPCTGCFGCWIKTPGQCVIADEARVIPEKIVASDLLVNFTPVTFGGYSYELKKVLDRSVCSLLLPFFTRIDGEVHHPPRYRRNPLMVGLGVLR